MGETRLGFDDGMGFEYGQHDAPRFKVGKYGDDTVFAIEENGVDRKFHEEHVDGVARLDPEGVVGGQGIATEQSFEPKKHAR